MNQSQIYSLAKTTGLSDANAKIAAAIAMAESGGNENQITQDSDDDSYGLWQINMIGTLGPDRRFVYRLKADSDLLNPQTNARVMSAISQQGKNFSAWTTFTSGKYKTFIGNPVSTVAVAPAGGAGTDNSVPNLINAAGDFVDLATSEVDTLVKVGTAVTKAGAWISNPSNWVRVAYVGGGIMLVTLGLYAVIGSTETGRTATNLAVKGAKKAAVVAAA